MFFKEKKAPLLIALALVLIMQIAFSGGDMINKKNVSTANGGSESTTVDSVNPGLTYEDSDVIVKLNVVYKNTLTSTENSDVVTEQAIRAYYNKIVSFTVERLCIYAEPKNTSRVVGVMYSGTQGDVIEVGSEWTLIKSGDVTGYVKNVAVLFGEEAEKMAKMIGKITKTFAQDGVVMYSLPDTEAEVVGTYNKTAELEIMGEHDDYLLVVADGDMGYVAKDAVKISYGMPNAMTIEEEQKKKAEEAKQAAILAAQKAQEAEKNGNASGKQLFNVPITQRTPYNATPEELHLMAAIIYRESNNQPFAGKLAVANVIVNRVFNKRFKQNNITDVIYAPNQFAGTGVNGVPSQAFLKYYNMTDEQLNKTGCYDAAVQACAGVNNIGDLCYFVAPWSKIYDSLIAKSTAYYVIAGHTFYTMY